MLHRFLVSRNETLTLLADHPEYHRGGVLATWAIRSRFSES